MISRATEQVNIGPRETRKRLLLGIVMIGSTIVVAAIFFNAGVSRTWYLALFPPFWAGTLGLFQARRKT